jgi:hypothetical protein
MKLAEALLIVALAAGVSGCSLRKPKPVSAAPAPPKPAVAPAPAPPPEPLSIPQTNVHLSPPQPLTPEAIATTQLPGEPPPTPAQPPRPQPKRPQPARPVVEQPPAAPVPAPPTTVEPGRAPITEVLAPAELKRLQDEAGTRVLEARKVLAQIPRSRLREQRTTVNRVETFLKQAEEAERRGDMRQASELAGRALVLARELKP